MSKIGVFIVDDSAVVRRVLKEVFGRDPGIEVIGSAMDPLFAEDKMRQRWPDVVVLDIEMPRMDGVTFLRKIMGERPMPVVICSTLTAKGADITMAALSAGAATVVEKPKVRLRDFLEDSGARLVEAVKAAARANVRLVAAHPPPPQRGPAPRCRTESPPCAPRPWSTTDRIAVMGTSTGGTRALEVVLGALPVDCPGIAVVQHMPEQFTAAFARRLDAASAIRVKEAEHGDRLVPGLALTANGGRHLRIRRSGAYYYAEIVDGPPVSRHRPSVDVLFRSAARQAGPNALGIIMTGMGNDGAAGLRELHQSGAHTLAQDEESCVVFGMPKEAIRIGAANRVVSLGAIAQHIVDFAHARGAAA